MQCGGDGETGKSSEGCENESWKSTLERETLTIDEKGKEVGKAKTAKNM